MNLLAFLTRKHPETPVQRNPARELALIGVRQHRERVKAMARLMREQCDLPPDPRLA